MSLYLFTVCVLATLLSISFVASVVRPEPEDGHVFLGSLFRRLTDLFLTAFLVSLSLCVALLVLQIYYWNGTSVGELDALDQSRSWLSQLLDNWLPEPWLLAVLAFVLILLLAGAEKRKANDTDSRATRFAAYFVVAQRWLGRLSVATAILASFTFLTSGTPAARSWIDFRLMEARVHAEAIDEAADDLALNAIGDDLLFYATETLDADTRAVFSEGQDAFENLESHVRANRDEISYQALAPAQNFLDENFKGSSAEIVSKPRTEPARLKAYDKLSLGELREAREAVEEIRKSPPRAETAVKVAEKVRSVFYESAARAVINRSFAGGSVTGNPLADLLVETLTESTVEQARLHFAPRAARIKAAVARTAAATREQIREAVGNAMRMIEVEQWSAAKGQSGGSAKAIVELSETAKNLQAAAKPIRSVPALPHHVQDLINRMNNPPPPGRLSSGDPGCPPGQIWLTCTRTGAPVCGDPSQEGDPC